MLGASRCDVISTNGMLPHTETLVGLAARLTAGGACLAAAEKAVSIGFVVAAGCRCRRRLQRHYVPCRAMCVELLSISLDAQSLLGIPNAFEDLLDRNGRAAATCIVEYL